MKKIIKFLSFICTIITGYSQGSQNVKPYQITLSFKKNNVSNPPSIKNQLSKPLYYPQKQNHDQSNSRDIKQKTRQEIQALIFKDQDSRMLALFDLFKKEYNLKDSFKLDSNPRLFLSFLIGHPQATIDDVKLTLDRIKQNNQRFIIDYETIYRSNIQSGDNTPTPKNSSRFCSINDPKIQYIFQSMLEDALITLSKQ